MNTTIKHKITLAVFFILISLSAYAQSKNEQIQILTGKIDSLTTVAKQENLKFAALENQLKTTINELKKTVNELKSTIQNKNDAINDLTLDLASLKKSAGIQIDYLQAMHPYLKNQPKSEFNFITVNYANLVNGFKVKAIWLPTLVNSEFAGMHGSVTGEAILQFSNTKDSLLFSVNADYFALSKELFSITYTNTDSVDIASLNTTEITLQYNAAKQTDRSEPLDFDDEFGFGDVDFDGEKELLVKSGFGLGGVSNSGSTYDAYQIYDDGIRKLSDAPFNELDDATYFNYAAKTITISNQLINAMGYCNYQYTTYSKKGYEIIPTEIVKRETDTAGNCVEYTYKITKNLQLLKKEVLRN